MKIYGGTGVTQTGELVLTKGIGSLIVCSSLAYSALTTETISVTVEKAGKNKDIAIDMLLKDFIALGAYGEEAIHRLGTLLTVANIELTDDGGYVHLMENETIKIKMTNLDAAQTYELHGIEEPIASQELMMYQRKTMMQDSLNQDFDVIGYDLLSLTDDASISEVALTYDNGSVCKHTPFELRVLQLTVDPIAIVGSDKIEPLLSGRLLIPLKGIVNVNIRKTAGTMLNLSLRIDESDWQQYQMMKR